MTPTAPRIAVFPNADAVANAAARRVVSEAARAIGARGGFRFGVSGGRIAERLFRALIEPPVVDGVDWSRTEVLFADERAVPPDHPDSNYRLAETAWLRHVPLPASRVHRMQGEADDLERAAQAYETNVAVPIDLLILGMGPDGHTASLFPRHAAVDERVRRVAAVFDAPKPPSRRLTLTPRTVDEARVVLVLVTGAEKHSALARALDTATSVRDVPARMARDREWLVDEEAAGALEARR